MQATPPFVEQAGRASAGDDYRSVWHWQHAEKAIQCQVLDRWRSALRWSAATGWVLRITCDLYPAFIDGTCERERRDVAPALPHR